LRFLRWHRLPACVVIHRLEACATKAQILAVVNITACPKTGTGTLPLTLSEMWLST